MSIVNKISILNLARPSSACILIGSLRASRNFSTTSKVAQDHYKLLIVGGGTGGLSTGSKFARQLGQGKVALVDGAEWHYYQPGWTLAAAGIEKADAYKRPEKNFIPKGVDWFQNNVVSFDPENNSVQLENGKKIKYEYLIVATGIRIDFDGIKGLKEAMANDPQVVSMYSHESVQKVFPAIQNFKEGNAIFTFPKMPIKCPGAPQKIMYLAEDYMRKNGTREKANVIYATTIPAIFGVKKYAESLMKIVKERDIKLQTQTHLIEVDYKNKQAIFEKLDKPGEIIKMNYSLLHVAPPMRPIEVVKNSKLVDANGFVDIHKETLQHKKYENIFAIGDCTNMPTSKTAAAIAAQSPILFKNLKNLMNGSKDHVPHYDGYTSCPLVTGYNKLILAEFDFNGQPLETFPMDQGKESRLMYSLKKDFMPPLYWDGLLRGLWNGPGFARKLFLKN